MSNVQSLPSSELLVRALSSRALLPHHDVGHVIIIHFSRFGNGQVIDSGNQIHTKHQKKGVDKNYLSLPVLSTIQWIIQV